MGPVPLNGFISHPHAQYIDKDREFVQTQHPPLLTFQAYSVKQFQLYGPKDFETWWFYLKYRGWKDWCESHRILNCEMSLISTISQHGLMMMTFVELFSATPLHWRIGFRFNTIVPDEQAFEAIKAGVDSVLKGTKMILNSGEFRFMANKWKIHLRAHFRRVLRGKPLGSQFRACCPVFRQTPRVRWKDFPLCQGTLLSM